MYPRSNRLLLAALLLTAQPAVAAKLDWSVSAGAGYTDNATRVTTNEVSDTILSAGGTLSLDHEGSRLMTRIRGDGQFLHYTDNTYSDDFLGALDALLRFGIVPDRFLWVVQDNFGQVAGDPLTPVTPENRYNANVFSTGPDLRFRAGSANEFRVGGRYSMSDFQGNSRVDTTRWSADVAFVRLMSAASTMQLVASAYRTEFDQPGNPHYSVPSVYGRLEHKSLRQTLAVDLGATRMKVGGEYDTMPLLHVDWKRQLSPFLSLDVMLGNEYRNTTDQFVAAGDLPVPPEGTQDVPLTDTAYQSTTASAALRMSRPRTTLWVGAGYDNEDYKSLNTADRKSYNVGAGGSRRFTEHLTGLLDVHYEKREFSDVFGNDETTWVSARLEWRAGRATYLTLGWRGEDRSSTGTSGQYRENAVYLKADYHPGRSAQ